MFCGFKLKKSVLTGEGTFVSLIFLKRFLRPASWNKAAQLIHWIFSSWFERFKTRLRSPVSRDAFCSFFSRTRHFTNWTSGIKTALYRTLICADWFLLKYHSDQSANTTSYFTLIRLLLIKRLVELKSRKNVVRLSKVAEALFTDWLVSASS